MKDTHIIVLVFDVQFPLLSSFRFMIDLVKGVPNINFPNARHAYMHTHIHRYICIDHVCYESLE